MKKRISAALLALCLALALFPASAFGADGGFLDVKQDDYYADAVSWAVAGGITNGTGDHLFSPDKVCSREEILTFLWRAAEEPPVCEIAPVMVDWWFMSAVNWAYSEGMIDSLFQPNNPCTRADAVTYMWIAAGSPKAEQDVKFSDVPETADYAEAVRWAVGAGITEGTGDGSTFSPDLTCDRAQIVTFLFRAYA